MKQLIVLVAVLPLLLVFMMQATLDQKNSAQIGLFQQEVAVAREQARQAGCFSAAIQRNLKTRLGERLGILPEEIVITATEEVQYRLNYFTAGQQRGLIHYRISIPIKRLMAGTRLLGIPADANQGVYTIEGCTASERLPDAEGQS
ncbi:MAG TPA: hypothetical protein GX726_05410 [Clostridiales bacterium]|jgi:hypothetical protein|nr:hypothetical protein [Clostridiales bacterium]